MSVGNVVSSVCFYSNCNNCLKWVIFTHLKLWGCFTVKCLHVSLKLMEHASRIIRAVFWHGAHIFQTWKAAPNSKSDLDKRKSVNVVNMGSGFSASLPVHCRAKASSGNCLLFKWAVTAVCLCAAVIDLQTLTIFAGIVRPPFGWKKGIYHAAKWWICFFDYREGFVDLYLTLSPLDRMPEVWYLAQIMMLFFTCWPQLHLTHHNHV